MSIVEYSFGTRLQPMRPMITIGGIIKPYRLSCTLSHGMSIIPLYLDRSGRMVLTEERRVTNANFRFPLIAIYRILRSGGRVDTPLDNQILRLEYPYFVRFDTLSMESAFTDAQSLCPIIGVLATHDPN